MKKILRKLFKVEIVKATEIDQLRKFKAGVEHAKTYEDHINIRNRLILIVQGLTKKIKLMERMRKNESFKPHIESYSKKNEVHKIKSKLK